MRYLPPLKSLHYFMLAAKHLSFKRAATELNVTQAAISQQIRHLEAYLNAELFIRHGQQTRLTDTGLKLMPFVERGFDALQQGILSVTGDPQPGLLRLSTLHSFTSLWLVPRLAEFQQLHPDIMVQLTPGNQLVDFRDGVTDLAIRMGKGGYAPLTEKPLVRDSVILVASPALVDGMDVRDPKAVFSLPWIEDNSPDVQEIFERCCAKYSVDPKILVPVLRSDNSVPLIENAVAGRGFALVNAGLAADHLFAGRLIQLLDFAEPSPFHIFLVAPEQHFTWPKVRAFEDWFVPRVQSTYADVHSWIPKDNTRHNA